MIQDQDFMWTNSLQSLFIQILWGQIGVVTFWVDLTLLERGFFENKKWDNCLDDQTPHEWSSRIVGKGGFKRGVRDLLDDWSSYIWWIHSAEKGSTIKQEWFI